MAAITPLGCLMEAQRKILLKAPVCFEWDYDFKFNLPILFRLDKYL